MYGLTLKLRVVLLDRLLSKKSSLCADIADNGSYECVRFSTFLGQICLILSNVHAVASSD